MKSRWARAGLLAVSGLHRWLGVALCLAFALWFPSGIGMLYFDFPSVSLRDRLARAPNIDTTLVRVGPAEALAQLGWTTPVEAAKLTTFLGRPVYRFRGGQDGGATNTGGPGGAEGGEAFVYADTGEVRGTPNASERARVAAQWTGLPAESAKVEQIGAVDQWTVTSGLRNLRPLWRYTFADGQQVYIAGATGDVVQYTTRESRLGAYLGPIPHWFYFTPLRSRPVLWTRVVIGVSAVATIAALTGLVSEVLRYRRKRRSANRKVPALIKASAMRWHISLGTVFGVGAVTWAFSGMLCMDPFPWEPPDTSIGPRLSTLLRQPPDLSDSRWALSAWPFAANTSGVKELELITVAGEPATTSHFGDGHTTLSRRDASGWRGIDDAHVAAVISGGFTGEVREVRLLQDYDAYYYDNRGRLVLPVLVATTSSEHRYYVDPASARIVGAYEGNWVSRWLYDGLHSLSVPALTRRPLLRKVIVTFFMLGGTALSFTSVWLAWRVARRTTVRVRTSTRASGASTLVPST